MAHVNGTAVEIGIPLVLLLTVDDTVAILGAVAMLLFHVYITSTFPMAVPLLMTFPIFGSLRPDLVSFLPSMRQYAGNWASGTWAMRPTSVTGTSTTSASSLRCRPGWVSSPATWSWSTASPRPPRGATADHRSTA